MVFDPARLLGHRFSELGQRYEPRDAILYALGIGLGSDPLDEADLDHLLETRLKVLPTFAVTLASPGMWIRDPQFGIDFGRLVHSEQDAIFHNDLAPAGDVHATPRVALLADRGAGKGAVVVIERHVQDADDRKLATVRQTLLLRGDGGFGGDAPPPPTQHAIPDREPDYRLAIPVSPRAALIYRLSGDWNPLHADPVAAQAAGFNRPILHGLATYGMAGHAIMKATGRPLRRLACRFAGVVLPGDTLNLALWADGDDVLFEAHVADRRVLDRGLAELENAHAR